MKILNQVSIRSTIKGAVMRKLPVMAFLVLSGLMFSCQKEKEAIQPQQTDKQTLLKVPHYDSTNTQKVNWDQLPTQLRNAIPLKITEPNQKDQDKASQNARLAYSYYSYYLGPWGGGGGGPFYIYPPDGSRLYAMAIRSGDYIDQIIVWYITDSGTVYIGGQAGGEGGSYNLQFFSSNEYIYYIAGRSGAYVDQLSIYTNQKSFTYGGWGGAPFYSWVPDGYQVLGFWGRSGAYVDQIGFYVYTH